MVLNEKAVNRPKSHHQADQKAEGAAVTDRRCALCVTASNQFIAFSVQRARTRNSSDPGLTDPCEIPTEYQALSPRELICFGELFRGKPSLDLDKMAQATL
jgi:hypothetical protein